MHLGEKAGRRRFRPMTRPTARLAVIAGICAALSAFGMAPVLAMPVPNQPGFDSLPKLIGKPAKPKPVSIPAAPQNPWMAANPYNNIHNDASMTDSYQGMGPLGYKSQVTSATAKGECASITFNSKGQIVAVCILTHSYVTLMDAQTLKVLARTKMPESSSSGGKTDYTNYAGGYFYLDNKDRPVVSTATHHLVTYKRDGSSFKAVKDVDLSSAMDDSDSIQSALPDYSGNKWFITKQGVVGYVEKGSSTLAVTHLPEGEAIGNSFSMAPDGGIYIVSTKAM